MSSAWLGGYVTDVPDFPEPGVVFKDISPLLRDPDALRYAVEALADPFVGGGIDAVVGIDARGFILGAPVAYRLGCGFVPIRKPGKLPRVTIGRDYGLEYGVDRLEMHEDALAKDIRVLLIDDVLATGGTASAALDLLTSTGAEVAGVGFLIELAFLGGAARIDSVDPHVLLTYS